MHRRKLQLLQPNPEHSNQQHCDNSPLLRHSNRNQPAPTSLQPSPLPGFGWSWLEWAGFGWNGIMSCFFSSICDLITIRFSYDIMFGSRHTTQDQFSTNFAIQLKSDSLAFALIRTMPSCTVLDTFAVSHMMHCRELHCKVAWLELFTVLFVHAHADRRKRHR